MRKTALRKIFTTTWYINAQNYLSNFQLSESNRFFFPLPFSSYSDLRFGYGGHDQHSERLDGKSGEVCPLARCPIVTLN